MKLNKYLLIVLFVFISLLAIGTVSAVDDCNISDSSILSEQISCDDIQSSVDDLDNTSQDSTVDEVVSIGDEQNIDSNDILSEEHYELVSFGDEQNIDSNDILSEENYQIINIAEDEADQYLSCNAGGDVIGLSIDENNSINENLVGVSSSTDVLANIIDFLNEINPDLIAQISDFIIAHPDTLDILFKFMFEPVNENASLIEGLNNIVDGIDINYTNVVNKFVDNLIPNFNSTKIANEMVDLFKFNMSDLILFNSSSFDNFNFNELFSAFIINSTSISDSIGEIFSGITLNLTDLELFGVNATDIFDKFFDVIDKYNFTNEMDEVVNKILNNKSFSLEDIGNFLNDFAKQNNLTSVDILNIIDNLTDGVNFNLSDIFDLNDNINNVFNKIFRHTIDVNKFFTGVIGIIKSFDLNESALIDFSSKFFDVTVDYIINTIGDLNKIINASKIYISNIVNGLINISNEIKFNVSSIDNLGNIIYNSSTLNTSKIASGLAMVRDALNRNIPKIVDSINSFIDKLNSTISIITGYVNKIVDFISNFFNPSKQSTPESGTQPSKPSAPIKPASVTNVVAKNKAFKKSKKTKKFTATLKSGNAPVRNVIVYLKFKGKTYTAKTNANGKATFKLKISKKSKAKAVIKFGGNSLYKASSKKVKITIK